MARSMTQRAEWETDPGRFLHKCVDEGVNGRDLRELGYPTGPRGLDLIPLADAPQRAGYKTRGQLLLALTDLAVLEDPDQGDVVSGRQLDRLSGRADRDAARSALDPRRPSAEIRGPR